MFKGLTVTRIALVVNGFLMAVMYPLNMVILSRPDWVWNMPARNIPLEYMLVAIYVTMGLFLIWAARDPLRALPLIDFVIISGAVHGMVMIWAAANTPGEAHHFALRGDVNGTFIAPVTLALTHPRRFYLFGTRNKAAA